ncbi:MAG: hypothetical protein AAF824_20000, partial [Bacteroidota bacterium]
MCLPQPTLNQKLGHTLRSILSVCLLILWACVYNPLYAADYYVTTGGSDESGDGSAQNPWNSLRYAAEQVEENQGHVIHIGAGTFIEDGQVKIKPGISVKGAGIDQTIITAAPSFYTTFPFHPEDPYPFFEDLQLSYPLANMLISLSSNQGRVDGNQSISDLTIDGANKQIYGGILVYRRENVEIANVKVSETFFTGIWLFWSDHLSVHDIIIRDCSWGNSGFSSGGINIGGIKYADLYRLDIEEREQREGTKGGGYGLVAIGPWFENDLIDVKLHDSKIIVHFEGLWENGLAPNFCIEYHNVSSYNCEIYRNEVNNVMSLVDPSHADPTLGFDGKYQRDHSVRVYDNYFNIDNENGYPLEVTLNRVEIFNNLVNGNQSSSLFIANWETAERPVYDWHIHHNVIYDFAAGYPKTVLMLRQGISDLRFEHNTVEVSDESMSLFWFQGGNSQDIFVTNNLVYRINEVKQWGQPVADCIAELNVDYGWETDISDISLENNLFYNFDGNTFLKGGFTRFDGQPNGYDTYLPQNLFQANNLAADPLVQRSGDKPSPFFSLPPNSPAIDAGKMLDIQTFSGNGPDIGALETL